VAYEGVLMQMDVQVSVKLVLRVVACLLWLVLLLVWV
jgi:hypothetical protein